MILLLSFLAPTQTHRERERERGREGEREREREGERERGREREWPSFLKESKLGHESQTDLTRRGRVSRCSMTFSKRSDTQCIHFGFGRKLVYRCATASDAR